LLSKLKAALRTNARAVAADREYDAVIVGSGISAALIAHELSKAGKRVLIVEAGEETGRTESNYQAYLARFYTAVSKDNQSPFAANPDASMPRGPDVRKLQAGETDGSAYIVQSGPYVTDSVYTRVFGGTTMHWEAKTPRMLPDDFQTQTRFNQGVDWPLRYEEMRGDYERAEHEIGVSADADEQAYLGVSFPSGYRFPMQGLPLSYLDRKVHEGILGTQVELCGEQYPLQVRPFPQGRNSVPNPGYVPIGAVAAHQTDQGERCQGNTNCVPLCPVQAKYHAGKTLAKAMLEKGTVHVLLQAVASRVVVDPVTRLVSGVELKVYKSAASAEHEVVTVSGKIFVLAANAVENPRLMLASGFSSSSGLIGRNLMDHAYLLSWGLMPERCGTMRGTSCTGGIVDLRTGNFRRHQAAFSVDIHNDGWGWATGSPYSDLTELVDERNKFGRELRTAVIDRLSKQLLLAFMIEVLPSESNRVRIDPQYKDPLGNPRPVVSFAVPEYTLRGAAYARQFSRTVFARLGAEDYTQYDPQDYGYVCHEGEGYAIRGGNHLAGTHVMGLSARTSVVDVDQRSWDHENLYLVGGGSMPTIGTANVTLTLAALCYRSSRAMLKQLRAPMSRLAGTPEAPGIAS
jgi:choline dehydrogenase-like flavoprotein